jgi:hypothetical protein
MGLLDFIEIPVNVPKKEADFSLNRRFPNDAKYASEYVSQSPVIAAKIL